MAATQIPAGRLRRFFGWFAHHKITAVFGVLVLGLGIYLLSSWIVLQAQIHFERERFTAVSTEMVRIGDATESDSLLSKEYKDSCTHSNFDGVFAVDRISCNIVLDMTYKGAVADVVGSFVSGARSTLADEGVKIEKNTNEVDPMLLASYVFGYRGLRCGLDISPGPTEESLLAEAYCSGRARTDYFPVVNN